MYKIILASASPRRKEILETIGLDFQVITSDIDESFAWNLPPAQCVQELSMKKAQAVSQNIHHDAIIIGADTVVALNNTILNKPKDAEDAVNMLTSLQGKKHTVYTGVTIIVKNGDSVKTETYVDATDVLMRPLSQTEITTYVNTKEPLDKAGSYAIQGKGAILVESISGDYYNVVGLPIHIIQKAFALQGINITDYWR